MNGDAGRLRSYIISVNFASPAVEALSELWIAAMDDFAAFYQSIPDAKMERTIDADGTTALKVGRHVMESANEDLTWSLQTAGLPAPAAGDASPRRLHGKAFVNAEAERLRRIVPPALAAMSDEQLFEKGASGISPETILEHAIVHFYRHRRQLEKYLKL